MAKEKEKVEPHKKFRAGTITATVWENKGKDKQGEETTYMTVSVERNYTDKNKEWQKTSSMRKNDLPKVSLVCNKAFEYLSMREGGD